MYDDDDDGDDDDEDDDCDDDDDDDDGSQEQGGSSRLKHIHWVGQRLRMMYILCPTHGGNEDGTRSDCQ